METARSPSIRERVVVALDLIRHYLLNVAFLPMPLALAETSREFDFVTPQAFGRNMFPDDSRVLRFRNWCRQLCGKPRILTSSDVRKIRDECESDIEAFCRLEELGFDPGTPNRLLVIGTHNFLGGSPEDVPIIGQWEVCFALWGRFPLWYATHAKNIVVIWPPRSGYLSTHGILLEVQEIARTRTIGLSKPCILAHPEHMPRAYFLAQKIFGSSAVSYAMNDAFSCVRLDAWFNGQSVQWQTRGEWRWIVYELLARLHHRWNGWM